MKKFLFFLILLSFLISSTGFVSEKTIKLVTDQEKDGGFLITITKAAFEKVGYKVTIEYQPWARALYNVIHGTEEALLGAYYTEERAAAMQYSDLIGKSEMVFFKMKSSNINYAKLEDLKPYIIGIIRGAAYNPEFDDAKLLNKKEATDFIINIRRLTAGRIHLFLEKKYVVLYTLKNQFPDYYGKVDYLKKPLEELKFYNCFSKKIKGYQQKVIDFNKGLDLIKKDGTYDKIMAKELHE